MTNCASSPQDPFDIPPLDSDDIETLRARADADANAGVTPGSREWTDTTPGLPYFAYTQVCLLEIERLRDLIAVEFMASALISRAQGEQLDEHGEGLGELRNPAVAAGGKLVFVAPNGTMIATGFESAIAQTDAEQEPPRFLTTEATPVGGIAAIAAPGSLSAIPRPGGGSLAAGTYYYRVTALVDTRETTPSAALSVVLTAQGRISLSWPVVPGASGYMVYRGPAAGTTVLLAEAQGPAYDDYGTTAPGVAAPPGVNTTGGAWALTVLADEEGPDGNVPARSVTIPESPLDPLTSIVNPYALTGGADVQDDESYRRRLLAALRASAIGASTVADLERMALDEPSVGFAKVEPLWNGANTARIVATDHSNDPLPNDIVTAMQTRIDPIPAEGRGEALIGLAVTVTTTTAVVIVVSATILTREGYSLDGTGGTLPIREAIHEALATYVNALEPGEDVVYNHVEAAAFEAEGVYDIQSLLVNAGTTNVVIAATQSATINTTTGITLS
jgi:uncharacterized phage protein gp47/JayE